MKTILKRLTVDVPEQTFTEIKLLTVIYKKTIKEIIIEAIDALVKQPIKQKELTQLKHALYRSKYDSHEDGRK